ncbi:MAG TPA: hypothetical protein VIK65_01750 [Candidatus Limnocylindrales bacterium]
MSSLRRRLRSLLVALAVLALSAGVAFAGRGAHPTLPARDQPAAQGADTDGDDAATETEPPEAPDAEVPEATDDAGAQADEPTGGTPDQPTTDHPDNHGKLVSEAAQATTPTGFDNHGAFVRSIAQDNHGTAQAAAAKTKHAPKTPH